MKISSVRGVILEEIVLHLLEKVGYRIVQIGEDGAEKGKSGLEVQGRGERHQIDALAAFDYTPAFMYPLRLMVEAKCYAKDRPVGIEVARNAVGVLKDISENYFIHQSTTDKKDTLKLQRFNYQSAIFSTSGFTGGAERYAIAHQIFLIQYQNVWVLRPVVDALLLFDESCMLVHSEDNESITNRIRKFVRNVLNPEDAEVVDSPFSQKGEEFLKQEILSPLDEIQGSYFGMLQGKWPMHLLSKHALPSNLFINNDSIKCKVYGREDNKWSFVPLDIMQGNENYFRLEFDLPREILNLVNNASGDTTEIANIKKRHFSFISLSGVIGGIRRQVRLELDEDWISAYIKRYGKK